MRLFLVLLALLLGLWGLHTAAVQSAPIEPSSQTTAKIGWKGKILAKIQLKKQQAAPKKSQNYQIRTQMTAFLLCLCFGFLGAHRFYTGHYAIGLLQLCTLGCCGLFWVFDLVYIFMNKLPTAWGDELVPWSHMQADDDRGVPLTVD